MLYQLEVFEARHIANLASDARAVRNRLLEKAGMQETQPAFVALRRAIEALPSDIRERLWVVARAGRGDIASQDWDETVDLASTLAEDDIASDLVEDPDLHIHLRKGLYDLGETSLPTDGQ